MTVVGFCSVLAQEDNLGDVLIRREMLAMLRGACDGVIVYGGSVGRSYREAYDLLDGVEVIDEAWRFQARLIRSAIGPERPVLVFAPGPARLGTSPAAVLKGMVNLFNVLLVRAGRGVSLTLGRAIRGNGPITRVLELTSLRLQALYLARDSVTRDILGPGVLVAPDLAFARSDQAAGADALKDLLVLSFRGDREADRDVVRRAIHASRRLGLRPVLVTQVARDADQHGRLSREHDIDHLDWTGGHRDQMGRVTQAMTRACVVVSDRLHSLVLGARNGAVVVPVSRPGDDKLTATLGVVPRTEVSDEVRAAAESITGVAVGVDVRAAQAEIAQVRELVGASLAPLRRVS